ncbi:hypothetical protein [Haloarchaeobius litoreus]|uniref:Uncharacterized protein n=1 Tax=Haloarchaeobius litoreus TaxID=755306 RepID=A0ABD6DLN4_9EURY|nr:hypothetical protein [Haloarchaeobius litoreus]
MREDLDFRHATAMGVVVTLLMLALLPTAPAVPLLFGLTATVVPMLLATAERKRYAVAGTAYCLALGLALAVVDTVLGLAEGNTLVTGLLVFGAGSLLVVTAKAVGRRLARRTIGLLVGEEYAARVFDAIASIAALAGLVWTVLTAAEKVSRYAGFGVGGTATLALSLVGVEYNVTVPMLGGEVDAVLFLFVGCILAGFYTFESLHTTWLAAKETAKKSVDAGGTVKSKTAAAVADRRGGGSGGSEGRYDPDVEPGEPEPTEARTSRRDPDRRRDRDGRRERRGRSDRDRRGQHDRRSRDERRERRGSDERRERRDTDRRRERRGSDERRERRDTDRRRERRDTDRRRERRDTDRRRRDRRGEDEDDDRDARS